MLKRSSTNRVQLQQVLLNLVINAVKAMNDVGKDARELLIRTGGAEAGYVLVAVRDSGPRLDLKRVDHLFEAFYTTKPSGMGVGLAICRSISDAHGGRLWACTSEQRGAVFQFTQRVKRDEVVRPEHGRPDPVV